MKVNFMIANFAYGGVVGDKVMQYHSRITNWLTRQPFIDKIIPWCENDTPITMLRNKACLDALRADCTYLLMIDSDMHPDVYIHEDGSREFEWVKPFLKTALPFLMQHPGPAAIGAPYCGPAPAENIYVFRWQNMETNSANHSGVSLEQFTRPEAAEARGIQEVGALPTGLYLMDTRMLHHMPTPWFDYEYEKTKGPDGKVRDYRCRKISTEDVVFTRNASLLGFKQYVLWDAWQGHLKIKCVGMPHYLGPESVADDFRQALAETIPGHPAYKPIPTEPLFKTVDVQPDEPLLLQAANEKGEIPQPPLWIEEDEG